MLRILGIESSCDETAVAVIKKDQDTFVVEKNLVASQIKIHAKYGGVVPEVAARQHAEIIFPLLEEAEIPKNGDGIDAVAVTYGPGLAPALRVGVEAAKTIAWLWNKPLVPVNHLEGHLYSVWLNDSVPVFPILALLVSGGHTELILIKNHGDYELIGMTRDDAAGEAFDKIGKLLGLSYPGGPEIAKLAEQGNIRSIIFPRPMKESGDFDFSFSGLKTAVSVYLRNNKETPKANIAVCFQEAVVDSLVTKTLKAVQKYSPASVILTGGVSANKSLRNSLQDRLAHKFPNIKVYFPELQFTGDNAAMIAVAGATRFERGIFEKDLSKVIATPSLRLV